LTTFPGVANEEERMFLLAEFLW